MKTIFFSKFDDGESVSSIIFNIATIQLTISIAFHVVFMVSQFGKKSLKITVFDDFFFSNLMEHWFLHLKKFNFVEKNDFDCCIFAKKTLAKT